MFNPALEAICGIINRIHIDEEIIDTSVYSLSCHFVRRCQQLPTTKKEISSYLWLNSFKNIKDFQKWNIS